MANITERLNKAREVLERTEKAYFNALNAQSWETRDGQSSRRVENASLSSLARQYERAKKEVENLEAMQMGLHGSYAFRIGAKL